MIPASRAPHEVAALDHAAGTVLGQVEVDAKTNEIPAARGLLGLFDLTDTVASLDALHTQNDTAEFIVAAGGAYVMTIKKNRRALYDKAAGLPWRTNRTHTTEQRGHGRFETRHAQVFLVVADEFGFPYAAQVMRIQRHRTDYQGKRVKGVNRKPNKSSETVHVVSSLGHVQAPVATLARWGQSHWGIENKLHCVRDAVFNEDASLVRTGVGPRVMATLRNIAISVLRLVGRGDIKRTTDYYSSEFSRPTGLVSPVHEGL